MELKSCHNDLNGTVRAHPVGENRANEQARPARVCDVGTGHFSMRTVALEEHFNVPSLVARIDQAAIRRRGFPPPEDAPGEMAGPQAKLKELGASRLSEMDAAGIDVQVLSTAGPGADLLPGEEGVTFAREVNDTLARTIAEHPDRYAGFAHLPMQSPEGAADELERAVKTHGLCGAMVNGLTEGKFLDDPSFDVLLAKAEALDVPIYLHPNIPPAAVRAAYYEGLPKPSVSFALSIAGWGWHSETAVHVLRLVLSGALDRHPRLKIIIGHMGEMLPMMLVRSDKVLGGETASYLQRSIMQTVLDQVRVTTSGLFTLPPFQALLEVFGIERVMFSVDYPFSPNQAGRAFLDKLALSEEDKEKLTHGNADRLLKLQARR